MKKHLKKAAEKGLSSLLVFGLLSGIPCTVLAAGDLGSNDPGVQMNRTREYMERQRIARQIAEDKARERNKVEQPAPGGETAQTEAIRFVLKEVLFDPSEIIAGETLSQIARKYLDREVTLQDLYALAEEVNAIYRDGGYLTCRAFLPPQTISGGKVKIRLVEGKTGEVTIQGGKHTRPGYVRSQLSLQEGKINNIEQLNRDMFRFNGGNTAQMKIAMRAGKTPGTTDYVISIYEPPKNNVFTLYADNAGTDTSGEFRTGLFYTNRSLFGYRDELRLGYMRSKGLDSVSAGYTIPVGSTGTKLDLDYSTNATKIIDGPLEPLGVKGHSGQYGVALRQPLLVDETRRIEGGIRYQNYRSKSDFGSVHWIDDRISTISPFIALTNYGKNTLLYQKHSFDIGKWKNLAGESLNSFTYHLNSVYQRTFHAGQMMQARLDGQFSNKDYLSSADRFYIGGSYTVRGYDESFLSGDKGFALGLEYAAPIDRQKIASAFAFFDYGKVSGDSAYGDDTLMSAGAGLRASWKDFYASLALGIPLKREINGTRVKQGKLHFVVNGTF